MSKGHLAAGGGALEEGSAMLCECGLTAPARPPPLRPQARYGAVGTQGVEFERVTAEACGGDSSPGCGLCLCVPVRACTQPTCTHSTQHTADVHTQGLTGPQHIKALVRGRLVCVQNAASCRVRPPRSSASLAALLSLWAAQASARGTAPARGALLRVGRGRQLGGGVQPRLLGERPREAAGHVSTAL
jgi:hypothetical protein